VTFDLVTREVRDATFVPPRPLRLIADFQQQASRFFSSPALFAFAHGGEAPTLPRGRTESERRDRLFFEDAPPDFSVTPPNFKPGLCASCH
jgi:hypothetical protein